MLTKMGSGLILRGRDPAEAGSAPPKPLSPSLYSRHHRRPKTAPVTDCQHAKYGTANPSQTEAAVNFRGDIFYAGRGWLPG